VFASGGETFNRGAAAAAIVCPVRRHPRRDQRSVIGAVKPCAGSAVFLPENVAETLRFSSKVLKDIYLLFHPARSRKS
jgi:hypothetical protein